MRVWRYAPFLAWPVVAAITLAFRVPIARLAAAHDRIASMIELLNLQALVHHMRGDTAAALIPLERGLSLAAPRGFAPSGARYVLTQPDDRDATPQFEAVLAWLLDEAARLPAS